MMKFEDACNEANVHIKVGNALADLFGGVREFKKKLGSFDGANYQITPPFILNKEQMKEFLLKVSPVIQAASEDVVLSALMEFAPLSPRCTMRGAREVRNTIRYFSDHLTDEQIDSMLIDCARLHLALWFLFYSLSKVFK